jgi:hypothetical protein
METQDIAAIFVILFWLYVITNAVRTHRLLKNAYEEQYGL